MTSKFNIDDWVRRVQAGEDADLDEIKEFLSDGGGTAVRASPAGMAMWNEVMREADGDLARMIDLLSKKLNEGEQCKTTH